MGRVMAKVKLTNYADMVGLHEGRLRPEDVRSVEIEALADTGASLPILPADVVARLGVIEFDRRDMRYANGTKESLPIVGGIHLEVLGRRGVFAAAVVPAGVLPLIGHNVLQELDLVVDPRSQEMRVNPLSPDGPVVDCLAAS